MGTKMKGILKGLRYISQIFDEEKKEDIQIGYPTDVKHVAHIGWDGPSIDSPSWMQEFSTTEGFQSAPLDSTGKPIENPDIKWVSEDSSRRSKNSTSASPGKSLPELPKSSRRHNSEKSLIAESKESSTKSRHSRKQLSKESSDSTRLSRQPRDSNEPGSPSKKLPDIPRKSRQKKSKDNLSGSMSGSRCGSMRPSRSKGTSSASTITSTSPFSDPGPNTGSSMSEPCQSSRMKSLEQEEEKGSSGIS